MTRLDELQRLAEGMTDSELHEAFKVLNAEHKQRARTAALSFREGDRVRFASGKGGEVTGVVRRVNVRTVSVEADDGGSWRVSPHLLEPMARSDPVGERGVVVSTKPGDLVDDLGDPKEDLYEARDRLEQKVTRWFKRFADSRAFARLDENAREHADFVLESFADRLLTHYDALPAQWNETNVEMCVLDALPSKITAEEGFFHAVAPVLTAFFIFAQQEEVLPQGERLARVVEPLGSRIVEHSRDRSRWGVAKTIAMQMLETGVDMGDSEEVARFLAKKNAQNPRVSPPGGRPRPQGPPKTGRNQPCRCGSGKKYKKCCLETDPRKQ